MFYKIFDSSYILDSSFKTIMKEKLILILLLTTLIACDTASVDLDNENYDFDGNGGVKCEVNGVLLKPSTNGWGAARDELVISPTQYEGYMNLGFLNNGEIFRSVDIKIIDVGQQTIDEGDIYILENEQSSSFGRMTNYSYDDKNFTTSDQYIGELEIIYHDPENNILGGIFEFDAVNENGEVVEIRKGEFDMEY